MYANDSCHFMAARPWFTERPLLPCQLDWRQAFSCKLWAGCANQKWCDCYFQSASLPFMLRCHWRPEEGEWCVCSFTWSTCWFSKRLWGELDRGCWDDNKRRSGAERERERGAGSWGRAEGFLWMCHMYCYENNFFVIQLIKLNFPIGIAKNINFFLKKNSYFRCSIASRFLIGHRFS